MLAPIRPRPIIASSIVFTGRRAERSWPSIDPAARIGTARAGPMGTLARSQHDHHGGTPHGLVAARERERAAERVEAERRDGIALLVAGEEELAVWIDRRAARRIPVRPGLGNHLELAIHGHCEECETAVQSIAHIKEASVRRQQSR